MKLTKRSLFILSLAYITMLVSGCSTKKNTLVNRTYHNITARFNGFFYAEESLAEGIAILEKAHVDRYDKILPVFKYGTQQDSKTIFPQMDKAFKKSSAVIERHSMLIKGVEHVKWIDENYLIIGKTHFYKRDYFAGIEVFDYVSKQYKKQPTRFEARMWMARTYNELGIFDKAQALIDLIKDDKEFPKKYEAEFAAIQADFYLKQDLFQQASFFLAKAITLTKSKKVRTRYIYILAQVYQKLKDHPKAAIYFSRVIKMNPPYEMAFNAKINLARSYDKGKSGKEIKKQLLSMLKDVKNNEYNDQIYYSLAEISLKDNDTLQAIDYLLQSAHSSVSNNHQKGLSYLLLADIHFNRTSYANAQAYYDSTVMFINRDYQDFDLIDSKKDNLTGLVKNMRIVAHEDSLQKLAAMSESDRNAAIENYIAKLEEEAARQKEEEELFMQQSLLVNQNQSSQSSAANGGGSGSGWYFYNQTTLSFGYTEFAKKWGNRKLEDNWRRSNKQSFSTSGIDDYGNIIDSEDSAAAPGAAGKTINKDKNFYLKNIPLTLDQKNKSDQRIIESLYSMGLIYKEQLNNSAKAAATFEDLLKRYPKNKYELACYYQLYRLYLAMGNTAQADKYKNILTTSYPDSEYSKIILNPEYNKQAAAAKSHIEDVYEQAYNAYIAGNYASTITICDQAQVDFGKNFLAGKFALLRALAIGKSQDVESFKTSLKTVIATYPTDPVKERAQSILNAISKTGQPPAPQDSAAVKTEIYKLNLDGPHHVMMIVNAEGGLDVNSVKISLSDFNSKYFADDKLSVTNVLLDKDRHVFSVKTFANAQLALKYYNSLRTDMDVLNSLKGKPYLIYPISEENFSIFYKDKSTDMYAEFFQGNYPQ